MKVIVAGLSKTGTKSMQFALKELGYNVYDFMENYMYYGKKWEKIFAFGGTTDDFYEMYKDVDAVTDCPAAYFWDEIHKAFPNAKVILTIRDSEDIWFKSMEKQLQSESTPYGLLTTYFSPTMRKFWKWNLMALNGMYGHSGNYYVFNSSSFNMLLMRMAYRRHNSHVLQTAPKDKLLVFNVKEGWEPLCRFLDVPVPDKPFPHKNIQAQLVDQMNEEDKLFLRAQREFKFVMLLLTISSAFGIYKIATSSVFSSVKEVLTRSINCLPFN